MNHFRWSAARRAAFVLVAFGVAACGDSSGPPKAGPPTALAILSGATQNGQSGEPLAAPLTVKATDKDGRSVTNAIVTFTVAAGGGTLSATTDTTDSQGVASVTWTMGGLLGTARVEARVTGLITPAVFTAAVTAGPATIVEHVSPAIGNSASGFDVLDSVAVRVTDRFAHPVANAQVTFAVTAGGGSVSHASKSTGDDGIARITWRFGNGGAQTLRATAGALEASISGTAVNCAESQLAVGEVLSLAAGAPACVVMNGAAQRFLVTVANSSNTASSSTSFRFRGASPAPASMAATSTPTQPVPTTPGASAIVVEQARAQAQAHREVMRANAELLDQFGPARKAQLRQLRSAGKQIVQAVPLPNLGDVLPVRIPSFQNLCSVSLASQIGARVAYVGSHGVILEDTLAPLRGENDAVYQTVGQEFDNVMWPILTTNYGNPLAMDAELDNNGRIFMVFSPHLNTLQGGTIAGFVSSGDFFPNTGQLGQSCAASNFGEYFYARVPGVSGLTAEDWLRQTRTVIIHEVKHLASFAEKFASPDVVPNGFFSSDQWLEEATAMVAEELWARGVFGYGFKGNVDYRTSIFCEVRPTTCPGSPISMFDHFYWLTLFAKDTELKSPIAPPGEDPSVYGSSWLFVRWLLDQYAASESAFLSAIAHETQHPGVESIETRTNKSFTELIADWATAFALDDHPGLTSMNPKHQVLSWNIRDIYAGLHADFQNNGNLPFQQPFPLKLRPAGFGKFLIDIGSVRGGGMSVFEISGSQTARQLFEFKGSVGTELPSELRVNIARTQ